MKKHLTTLVVTLVSIFTIAGVVWAANTFPTTLNDWEDGEIIESDWADAIEAKIGINGSGVTSSLDYLLRNASSIDPGHLHTSAGISGTLSDSVVADNITASNYLPLAGGTLTGNLIGTGASFSGNINFLGELKPDNELCSNGQILKKTAANDWDCAADNSGSGIKTEEGGTQNLSGATILNFDPGKFTLTASGSTESIIGFDWGAGGAASLSEAETITGNWVNTSNPWADNEVADILTVSGGTIGSNNISGTLTTTSTLTIGDNGDAVNFDTSTWDVTAGAFTGITNLTMSGHLSGATASLSGNFQTSSRIIAGTASHSFGGTIEGLTDNTLSFGTTAKKIKRIVVNTLLAIAKLVIPLNITPSEDGELAYHQASDSFDVYNGTSATAMLLKCDVNKTLYYESPTKTKPTGLGFRITEPLTIFSIHSIASPSSVGVGWNLRDTAGNLVFSAQKSASSSFTYTSFTKSTFGKNTNLTLDIASKSAVSEFIRIDLCGFHNH